MNTSDCLRLLSIEGTPTKIVVKKAFRKAALRYHPDTRGSNVDFIRIKTAYDTLMALSSEELARISPIKNTPSVPGNHYDPFSDPDYGSHVFFEPENPATEGFERKLRAKHCPYCHELGFITKNVDPSKGFMGRERRLCKCQWA